MQECIGQILSRIEARATYGFTCVLGGRKMHLFAKLGAMTLDTPERVKYFGLRSQRACGFCRVRSGRSITRRSTRHDPRLIQLLLQWATRPGNQTTLRSQRARAREKLKRHGFNYKRRCRLWEFVRKCVVHVPQLPDAAFAALIQFERLHVFFIVYCTYCTELLVQCVDQDYIAFVHECVKACHQFRDPETGKSHPRLLSVLQLTHLTAERRVRSIFYWAHVLGTKAEVIVEEMRTHAQAAVSTLQLLLIATRGHRAYTKKELDIIFNDVGRQFFIELESMAEYADKIRIAKGKEAHRRRPRTTNPPRPFKRLKR